MKKYLPILILLLFANTHAATTNDFFELQQHLFHSLKNDLLQMRAKTKTLHLKERYLTEKEFNQQSSIRLHLDEKLLIPWSLMNDGIPCVNVSPSNIIRASDVIATSKGLSFSFIPISPGVATLTMCYGIGRNKYKKIIINIKY